MGFFGTGGSVPTNGLIGRYESDLGVARTYNSIAQTATGTSGASSFLMSADRSSDLFPNMLIRLAGTDIYTISTVSGTTVNIVGTLSTNYVASAIAVEGISQWNDQSGLGNHITMGTASKQPWYIPNHINAHPAVLFSDNSHELTAPSGLYSLFGTTPLTIFANIYSNQQDYSSRIFVAADAGGTRVAFGTTSTSTGGVTFGHDNAGATVDKIVTNTQWAVWRGRRNGTTMAITQNNAAEVTSSIADDLTLVSARVGNNSFDGMLLDLFIYNRALDANETNAVQSYMAVRSGAILS